jgi:xylose isomerase
VGTCTTTISSDRRHARQRDRIVTEFKAACDSHKIVVPMATVSLSSIRRSATAFTANDLAVCAYAVQKTMRAMTSARSWREDLVLWGGREGTETDACRRPDEAVKRLRYAIDYLCEHERQELTATSSRWRPPNSRAATSTWPRPGTTSGSSPRWRTPRWSA